MDTSIDQYTRLLLTHGNVQTSPQQAAKLNSQGGAVFQGLFFTSGIKAGYEIILTGYAEYIRALEEKINRDDYLSLDKLLTSLKSVPRAHDANIVKGSVSTFQLKNNIYRVDYQIANGQVSVFNIQVIDKDQRLRDKQEKIALYHVKRNTEGMWQVSAKVDKITTRYAAVNGQSNNLTKATWLMGSHLEFEFKNLNEYTLFHNPSIGGMGDTWESFRDKMGITTPVTKAFAKILTDTQVAGNETSWVAHSQGGAIFAEGVRYALNGNSSWSLNKLRMNGVRHPEKGEALNKHSIAFHANANNNLRTKPLLKRAGIKVIAIRANDYDMVPNLIGLNTLNPRKLIGSMLYANHVFNGSVEQSPHTLMQSQSDWDNNMTNGNGKGRGPVQKTFDKLVKPKPNYLP